MRRKMKCETSKYFAKGQFASSQNEYARQEKTQSNRLLRRYLPSVLAIGLVFGSSLPSFAQNLKSVLESSVYSHPEYLALKSNRSAIGEELVAARGLGLPGVNLEYRKGHLNDDNTSQGYEEWSAVMRQPLFDGGKTLSEVGRQGERVLSANERTRDTENTIGLQVVQSYLEVLRSRRVLAIAHKNERAVRGIVNRVNAKARGGTATEADKELALSRLYAARNITAESEIRLRDAEALYKTLVRSEPGKLSTVKLNRSALPRTRAQAVAQGSTASPKILAMRHDAIAAEFAIGTAKSAIMPTVDAELSANYRDRVAGTSAENTTYKAMLVFKMSLYNGGINAARIREAEHRAREANELAEAAVLNVEREIRLAWNTFHGAPKKVSALSNQATSSLRVRKLREKQYEVGTSSLIAILDAQNEYAIAKVQAINEESMRKFAYFKILAATGMLMEAQGLVDESNDIDTSIITSSIAIPSLRPRLTTQASLSPVVAPASSKQKRGLARLREQLNEEGR